MHYKQPLLWAMIENLRAEMSFEVRHQEFNDVFTLESITKTSFSDCQKHEDITVGWTDKDSFFSVFIFSIIRGLISYVFIIDIYIWSFIINKNNNIHLLEHYCHLRPLDFDLPPSSVKWHCRVANQNLQVSNDNNALKINTIVIFLFVTNHNLQLCILQLHYKRLPYNECWVLCVFIYFFYLAFSCISYLVGIFHVWKGVGSRMKPSKTPALTAHSSEDFASWITRSRLLLINDY